MDAAFGVRNLRAFNHALSCLGRFSESLNLQCMRDEDESLKLRLSAINSSQSAFCSFTFVDSFFDSFTAAPDKRVECLIHIKSFQAMLRSSTNKGLERCEISVIDNERESRVAVRMHCSRGVTKTHKLTFEAQAGLWPNAAASSINHLQIGARVVAELLEHFSNKNGGEVTFWCAPTFLVVRSRSEDVLEKNHHIRRSIQTNVKVDLDAFEIFKVTREACVTFPLKEFKAAIAASEHLGVPLELFFSHGEEPLHIHCLRDDLQAEWVIATTEGERPPEQAGAMGPPAPPAAAGQAAAAPGHAVPSAAARAASQRAAPRQEAESVSGSHGANGAAAPSASMSRSMPGASAARAPSSPPRRPMESTPLPHARPAQELPLFRGGTQGSQAEGSQEQRSDDEEMAAAAAAEADGEEAEEDDSDWAAVDALEQSISRGEVEMHGSQVVLSASQRPRPPTQPAPAAAAARAASLEARPATQARADMGAAASPPSRRLYVSSGISQAQAPRSQHTTGSQQPQPPPQLARLAEEEGASTPSSSSLGIAVSQADFAEHARRRSSIRRNNEAPENRSVEPPERSSQGRGGGVASAAARQPPAAAPPQPPPQQQPARAKVSLAWRASQAAAGAMSQGLGANGVEEQPPPASWRDALHAAEPPSDDDDEGEELPASDEEDAAAAMGQAAKRFKPLF